MLTFTTDELRHLGHTADALCAWLGKPVVAEVVQEPDAGYEWVLFAIPFDPADADEDAMHVQVGGPGARILASQGGLNFADGAPLDCRLLWAIQRSDQAGARFVKVDANGEETGGSDDLTELLPFGLEDNPHDAREDMLDDEPDDDDGSDGDPDGAQNDSQDDPDTDWR